ncbi:MAG TPA: hypothetical protein VFZ68_09560 [Acidimicrobiales bacterium]
MTVQKSFKRLVRARMAKTGESYTAARAQLLAGVDSRKPADEDIPQLACSDKRIRERTGRGWEEWFDLLDSWGAGSMAHSEVVHRVAEVLGVLGWDAQAVAGSFERARGKRAVGQRIGGDGFVAGASKTVGASAERAFMAFVDPSRRAGWLADVELSERTVSKPRIARFDVGDGTTRLLVAVEAKGPEKSTVVVEQSRLADGDEREARKAYWRQALARLKAELERDVTLVAGGRR